MNNHETWRTRAYWKTIGGLLIEEFIVVKRSSNQGVRLIDGVIILNEKKAIHKTNYFGIAGHDLICVQTKRGRLGMHVMGQAFFSRELLKKHKPNSIKSVIVCGKDDAALNTLCKKFKLEVVIIPDKD